MDYGIKGKIAFVGGSSDGIGKAIAESLAAEGCNVLLCARSAEKLDALADTLKVTYGITAESYPTDLDDKAAIDATVSAVLSKHGKVDILVTNNGGPPPGNFESLDEDAWEHGWNRTLMSAVRLINAFLPGMKQQSWGRIINITSIAPYLGIDLKLGDGSACEAYKGVLDLPIRYVTSTTMI